MFTCMPKVFVNVKTWDKTETDESVHVKTLMNLFYLTSAHAAQASQNTFMY